MEHYTCKDCHREIRYASVTDRLGEAKLCPQCFTKNELAKKEVAKNKLNPSRHFYLYARFTTHCTNSKSSYCKKSLSIFRIE